MTHLELENLASDYLEGRLDAARLAEAEQHLAGCPSCREVLSDVSQAIKTCRSALEVTPPPWLVSRIRQSTVGEAPSGITEQITTLVRRIRQPRLAYALAMTVFSISLIANIAGLNFRQMNVQDLNPATWVYRANRIGHLLYARAEKFYDDLRIVYEIESRFRNAKSQSDEKEKQTSKPKPSEGRPASTTDPGGRRMATAKANVPGQYAQIEPGVGTHEMR